MMVVVVVVVDVHKMILLAALRLSQHLITAG